MFSSISTLTSPHHLSLSPSITCLYSLPFSNINMPKCLLNHYDTMWIMVYCILVHWLASILNFRVGYSYILKSSFMGPTDHISSCHESNSKDDLAAHLYYFFDSLKTQTYNGQSKQNYIILCQLVAWQSNDRCWVLHKFMVNPITASES